MELHFSNTGIPCLKTVKQDVQTQEQTQEVKLTEGLPDMGRVLGVWGQSVLRGKQWQGEEATVSCGAMVWVKLGRLVYGASDMELCEILGVEGCKCCKTVFEGMGHPIEVTAGVLREESLRQLKDYFSGHAKG